MTGVRKSLNWTQTGTIAEALSAESCHIVLETSPPDYVEKISRYLESSVGQCRQDKVSKDPTEAESDSGDSLFITQKTVPEAVRSGRRRHCSLRSDPTSPRNPEESEDDTSSSASHGDSKTDKSRRRKKFRLPKYSFPFLTERKWKPKSTLLSVQQNTTLHNSAMGGFFKCVRELWQGYQRDDLESSLPKVDMDRECISPLSEEEGSESEDIKVVERKRFVATSKAKCSQPWYTPEKRDSQVKQRKRTRANNARQEMSQGRRMKILYKIPAKAPISSVTALCSDTESSDNGDPSRRVLAERKTSDKCVTIDRSILAQTETPKTNRRLTRGNKNILFQEKEREDELCNDSDATVCDPLELQGSPREYTLKGREASPNVTEPQVDVFHTDDRSQTGQSEDEPESQSLLQSLPDLVSDINNDRVHNETRGKKKKKAKVDNEIAEEKEGQGQEEPEGLDAAASVRVEAEETPSLSEDNRADPPASQTSDELELNEENRMENSSHGDILLRQGDRHFPDSKQKKKKRKKNKSAADNFRQEEDGNLESGVRFEKDSLFSVTLNMVNSGEVKKKKKKKRSVEDDESVEQLQSGTVSEPLNDDAETQKKKKKRKKQKKIVNMEECEEEEALNMNSDLPLMSKGQLEEIGSGLENTEASQETLESSSEKKRKKHKKKQLSGSQDGAQVGAEDGVDLSSSNDVGLEGSAGWPVKKKKKKKRRESISEGVDISCTPDKNKKVNNADYSQKTKEGPDDQDADLVTKKKKKKKKREIFSRNVSEDTAAQSDDSVSVRKKEKRTSSFLIADAEEKNSQTREEQSSPCSKSVAAHVWGAEKPGVSAGDFETESAEIFGNSESPNDGVRKRKRKMSVLKERVEKDHQQDFEKPNETCHSDSPKPTETGVKKKKKRKRNESESVTPVERLESAADAGLSQTDEAVVLKRKKKKKKWKDEQCHVIRESPPTATDDVESEGATRKPTSSVSRKKKGKQSTFPLVAKERHGHCAEIPHDSGTSDKVTKETLNVAEHASPSSETSGNPVLNGVRDKKNKKIKSTDNVLLEGKLTQSAEIETHKTKRKEKKERNKLTAVPSFITSSPASSETSLSHFETSFSERIMKNKHMKGKRRLHNPSEDFFTDY